MQNRYIPARKKKKLKINKDKAIIAILAVVLLLCSLTAGMLVAKYINEKNSYGLVKAYEFYFTSNLLDGKTHTLAPVNENEKTSVTFTVGNHADDLRYSEVDIDYEYEVTVDDNGATVTNGTGKLTSGSVKDATITVEGLEAGKTYIIKAVGTGGYTKTLTATIVVPKTETKIYYDVDFPEAEYTTVTIWNEGDKAGDVTVTYTGIPDNTNPNMTSWETNYSGTLTIGPHESIVLRFFGETAITDVTGATAKNLY